MASSLASWPLGKGSRATPIERKCHTVPTAGEPGRQAGRVGWAGPRGQDMGWGPWMWAPTLALALGSRGPWGAVLSLSQDPSVPLVGLTGR